MERVARFPVGDVDAADAARSSAVEERCRELLRLSVADYERIRSHPSRFLVAAGHDHSEHELVVAACDGYVVVEKQGRAGALVEEADARRQSEEG
jgi:hypothetical protein